MSTTIVSTLLLLLLLCHAMKGSNGRHLGMGKERHKHHVHHSSKDVANKAAIDDISKENPHLVKENIPKRKHRKATRSSNNGRVAVNDNSFDNGPISTDHQEQIKHPDVMLKEDRKRVQMIQGNEVKIISNMVLQPSTKTKGAERQERSMLRSPKSQFKDEKIDHSDTKENDIGVVEDVVVMDYAQPHKKPPIHNFSP